MKKYVFLFAVLLIGSITFGQSKSIWVYEADNDYSMANYASALTNYKKALNDSLGLSTRIYPYEVDVSNQKIGKKERQVDSTLKVSMYDYINHQMGMCYHYTADYNHAVKHFKRTSKVKAYPEDVYYYGVALMEVGKYEEAITIFEQYLSMANKKDLLEKKSRSAIEGCRDAMRKNATKKEVVVTLADTAVFNKGTASFAAMFWGHDERIIFTSARPGGFIIDPTQQESEFLCDLYWTEKEDSNKWGKAHNFGRPLNSAQHDAAGCFNNTNVVFFTRWSDENKGMQKIHLARMLNLKFFEVVELDSAVNYPGYRSMHPFISKDGKTLYFSSDRPGGYGGLDIWKIAINENGQLVGKAENLGDVINTTFDEGTPFYHTPSSTLFFSSEGHHSFGGLDIFKSLLDENTGSYTTPSNMGFPINSSKDDAYMIWDETLHHGYLSSDREDCPTGHCYDIYEVSNDGVEIVMQGYAFDSETEAPLPNTKITFSDVRYGFEPFVVYTDDKGYYSVPLDRNIEVFIKAQKPSYFAKAASANTNLITESTVLQQDFYLDKISDEEIEIQGIEYDFDSDRLRPISELILDTLYEFLSFNDNLIVEINSHTDHRGNDEYNLDLSQRRAKSCVDYLIRKGIPKERLSPRGYGEKQNNYLRDENKNPVLDKDGNKIRLTEEFINSRPTEEEREELHQRNRRTAFKVVGEGFIMKSKNNL